MKRIPSALTAAIVAGLVVGGTASAAEPKLSEPQKKLNSAIHCPIKLNKREQPVLLVTGTGYTGEEAYAFGKPAFELRGTPVCYVNFPYRTTGDIQLSVEYLVNAIRWMERRADRPIAIFGISQGGLLPRWALTYWPSLRPKVTDVLSVAGTHHGTVLAPCSAENPCSPAGWQQKAGSALLKAVNRQPDETPGPTDWTTVRSATDETVQPQTGRNPTSALEGASNILIQDVCPGREVGHIASGLDSVTYAAFIDAIEHEGPGKRSRLPDDVCDKLLAPGLGAKANVFAAGAFTGTENEAHPVVPREPKVKSYAKRIVKK